jgi:hypothetical protein
VNSTMGCISSKEIAEIEKVVQTKEFVSLVEDIKK